MKKLLVLALALMMTLSLAACGEKETPAPASSVAPPPTSSAAPATDKPDLANPEYTPEQLAVAEKFAAMTDRFQTLADKINADESLLAVTELVDTMNMLVDAVNEDDALFADPAKLTAEVLVNLEDGIVVGNGLLDELEAMVANYAGKTVITINATVVNQTDADLHGLAISPVNTESWGGNLLDEPLKIGESGTLEMTITEDSLVWDILAGDSEGTTLEFMGLDFSEVDIEKGATITLVATEGGYMADVA